MIYLDESGNLGFGEKADKYSALAAIIARELARPVFSWG
jgi:hypothetical protein